MRIGRVAALAIAMVCIFGIGTALAMDHSMMRKMDGKSCRFCGMDLEKFASTKMVITYEDGSTVEVCSLHCAALEMSLNMDRAPKTITVGDMTTSEQIDAEKAHWVIVEGTPGVMTRNAKAAFLTPEAAQAYMTEKGGRMATFEEAMNAAYADMYQDTRMIRHKRMGMKKHDGAMPDMPKKDMKDMKDMHKEMHEKMQEKMQGMCECKCMGMSGEKAEDKAEDKTDEKAGENTEGASDGKTEEKPAATGHSH